MGQETDQVDGEVRGSESRYLTLRATEADPWATPRTPQRDGDGGHGFTEEPLLTFSSPLKRFSLAV